MPKLKPGTIVPTPEEEVAIRAGIASDPDAAELDDAWFAKARPVRTLRETSLPSAGLLVILEV